MIIDCHAHLESRMLDVDQLVQKMDRHGIDRVVLMAKITENIEPEKSAVLLGIQRAMMNSSVLRPGAALVSTTFYDAEGVLRPVWRPFTAGAAGYTKAMVPDNASVAAALERRPDRLWGWVFLNPKVAQPTPVDELEKWRAVRGMVGVKVHPYWHHYPLTALEAVARRAEELRLPMIVHLGFGGAGAFRWLVEHFPKLSVIFAHAGIPYFKALWPIVRDRPNAFIDVSSPHLSERFVRRAVRVVGAAKTLYGTDSPYGFPSADGTYDYGRVLGWVERLPVTDREREEILGGNFLRLVHA